jgi:UDP-N-acetylmuramate dehydrogenase
MMAAALAAPSGLRGELRHGEPLARHTSWRVGGPARTFYRPADREDLVAFLQALPPDEPVLWLGLGSNLLVRDGGYAGTVLALSGRLTALGMAGPDRLRAEAGVACAHVARFAARGGFVGLEFLAGIPGTMGGALAMNAGAFGGETWQRVIEVETIDRRGVVRLRNPADFAVGYREVRGPAGEWFLSGTLRLEPGDAAAAQQEIRRLLDRRAATQPTSQPSGGSTFRNPPDDYAARLIETAGLKGLRIGGAQVSEKHANFIVNLGNSTAADIEALIATVRERVLAVHGVALRAEVHVVGEAA